jgi:hypothetical protein
MVQNDPQRPLPIQDELVAEEAGEQVRAVEPPLPSLEYSWKCSASDNNNSVSGGHLYTLIRMKSNVYKKELGIQDILTPILSLPFSNKFIIMNNNSGFSV